MKQIIVNKKLYKKDPKIQEILNQINESFDVVKIINVTSYSCRIIIIYRCIYKTAFCYLTLQIHSGFNLSNYLEFNCYDLRGSLSDIQKLNSIISDLYIKYPYKFINYCITQTNK